MELVPLVPLVLSAMVQPLVFHAPQTVQDALLAIQKLENVRNVFLEVVLSLEVVLIAQNRPSVIIHSVSHVSMVLVVHHVDSVIQKQAVALNALQDLVCHNQHVPNVVTTLTVWETPLVFLV